MDVFKIAVTCFVLGGCSLHHPQELEKDDIQDHMRTYVNTPSSTFGKASLPGKVPYATLNKQGITAYEHGDSVKLILPTDDFFHENSDRLKEDKLSTLDEITKIVSNTTSAVIISGHTDGIGTREYKQSLSENLAIAIKDHLWKNDIEQNRVITMGFADRKPISEKTVAKNRINRRVEIQLRKK